MLWALFSPKRDQNRRWANGGVLAGPSNLELSLWALLGLGRLDIVIV